MANPHSPIRIAGADATIVRMSDPFQADCDVNGCSTNCCTRSAPIVLNPYEISLICRESGMSYEDLLDVVDTERARGFPLVLLPRDPACHFRSEQGCRIYESRPLACRLYPLGRVFDSGKSHIVLPAVNACSGLKFGSARTVAEYLELQDVRTQIRMADHWIEFVSEIEQFSLKDAPVTSVAFHLLVYSPDTPPSSGPLDAALSPEARFLLRLDTARKELLRFLKKA